MTPGLLTLAMPALALLAVPVAAAEEDPWSDRLSWSGYGEIRGTWNPTGEIHGYLLERVRPTLDVDLADRVRLTITPEARLEQGRYEPGELGLLLDEQLLTGIGIGLCAVKAYTGCQVQTTREVSFPEDVISLERLHLDVNLPAADLRIGRQAVAWGSAQVFNPTDVFSEVILAEPWRERAGVDVIRATVPMGPTAQVVAVAGVGDITDVLDSEVDSADPETPADWRAGGRATVNVAEIDLSLVGFTSADRVEEGTHLVGLDLRGTHTVGWWLEAGWDGHLEAALGTDYSFPVGQMLYIAGQVFHDGSGASPEEMDFTQRAAGYTVTDGSSIISGCTNLPPGIDLPFDPTGAEPVESRSTLGRWYGLLMIREVIDSSWTVNATVLLNLEDTTGLAFPSVAWSPGSRLSLNAGVQRFFGEEGEFRPPASALTYGPVDLSSLVPTWTGLAWARLSL